MIRLASFFALPVEIFILALKTVILTFVMAFVSYNNFNHPAGQVDVQFFYDAIQSEGEQIVAYKARGEVSGMLIGNGQTVAQCQADLTAKIQAIQEAYQNGGDLILVLDDGSQSANSIINSNTLGGTRVIRAPSFPQGRGAEYATYRNFVCSIEAEVPTPEGAEALWSFEESITFQGTGEEATDVIDCVQGDPQPQTLSQKTAMTAVQAGRAVGYLGYWTQRYATPLWPALEQKQFRVRVPGSPKRVGNGANATLKFFPTTWRYTFKSPTPFDTINTNPTPWPLL